MITEQTGVGPPAPARYRAVNATSEGIHNDEVARALGYTKGLVTGHAIISLVMDAAHRRWPGRWEREGSLRMWFSKPVYDGDEITVEIDDPAHQVVVRSRLSDVRATGRITDLSESTFSGSRRDFCRAEPDHRELTPAVAATAELLGTHDFIVDEAAFRGQLGRLGLDPGPSVVVGGSGVAYLYRQYVPFSRLNFVSDEGRPIVHMGAELEWYRPANFGEALSVRGRVDRTYCRRGVRYLVTELAWYDQANTIVLRAIHTVVYSVAPERPMLHSA